MTTKNVRRLLGRLICTYLLKVCSTSQIKASLIDELHNIIQKEAEKGYMLERSSAELRQKIANGQVVVAFLRFMKKPIGVCLFDVWSVGWLEIGGAAVEMRWRGFGIGTELIKACRDKALSAYPNATVFALTDSTNRPYSPRHPFIRAGFTEQSKAFYADDMDKVGVWKECQTGNCRHLFNFPDCQCRLMIKNNHLPSC